MPQTTVGAIIFKDEKRSERILLTRRNIEPYKGAWCFPGGHIDPFESARDAVIREVEEETGYVFEPEFFRYQDEIIPDEEIHHVVLFFTGTCSGEPDKQEAEVQEMEWFTLEEALEMNLAFLHREIIKNLLD